MSIIQRRPVLIYLALTFAVSWGAIFVVIGPGTVLDMEADTAALLPVAILAMMLGPFVAGIVMTGAVYGRIGLRALASRAVRWRVSPWWYVVAVLTAPVSVLAALLLLSILSPAYLPGIFVSDDKASIMMFAIVAAIFVAIFEETGWTGFATPELRKSHGVLWTGLFLGIFWGGWHLLVNVWGSSDAMGSVPSILFLAVVLFSFLPPYRVLMVLVYDRTGSLFMAMVMHASLIAFWQVFTPASISGWSLVTWFLAWAAILWIGVALITRLAARAERTMSGRA